MLIRSRTHRALALTALVVAPGLARAADLQDAQRFVQGLYQAERHGKSPFDHLGQVFAPELAGLIRRDAASVPKGDEGWLDYDPICSCQDNGGMTVPQITLAARGNGRASADVHFRIGQDRVAVTLDLQPMANGWRVSDVHTKDVPSLVEALKKAPHYK